MCRLLGLCSGTKVTGGKAVGDAIKPRANWAGQALRLAAALCLCSPVLGAYCRRVSARQGRYDGYPQAGPIDIRHARHGGGFHRLGTGPVVGGLPPAGLL